jgi:tRNA-binding protein
MENISWSDFEKIELRAGTVVEVKEFPEAKKPAFKLKIDFGEGIGIKQASAQITDHYTTKELLGKQVICVLNFPPKQIGPFISECLVTGLYREDNSVVLAVPDHEVSNGSKFG